MTADPDDVVDHDLTVLIARAGTEAQRGQEQRAADLAVEAMNRERPSNEP